MVKAQYDIAQLDADMKNTPIPKAFYPEIGLEAFIKNVGRLGYFNVFRDVDGAVRSYPMAIAYGDFVLASLAIQAVSQANGDDNFIYVTNIGVEDLGIGDKSIPVTLDGRLFINYYGPPKTFKYVSASDVIRKRVPKEFFKGKIVVVGATALGLFDNHVTPFSRVYPGPEIHATVISNLIKDDFLVPLKHNVPITVSLILLFSVITFFLLWKTSEIVATLASLIVGSGYIFLTIVAFNKGKLINVTYPTLSLIGSHFLNLIMKYQEQSRQRKRIKQAFSHYLHPKLVEEIDKNPQYLSLGGEKREVSVLFSDIRNFTTISERLDPEILVHLLNKHFSEMTRIIVKYNGFVDKFIGDCVMAVFGVPIPVKNHAYYAVKAGIEMVKSAKKLSKEWKQETGYPLHIGVGINVGTVLVGNIGSAERLNYTVLGDTVNLASRLEGQCKTYGVSIVASEFIIDQLPDESEIAYRKLDFIKVKGKTEPVTIYEILVDPVDKDIIKLYEQALILYKKRNWKRAIKLFKKGVGTKT